MRRRGLGGEGVIWFQNVPFFFPSMKPPTQSCAFERVSVVWFVSTD